MTATGCVRLTPPLVPQTTAQPARRDGSAPTHAYAVLYSFKGGADAAAPDAKLLYVAGKLYGTSTSGGHNDCFSAGCGTVYYASLSGQERVLHRFTGYPKDGSGPFSGLTSLSGKLYGMTASGGSDGRGTVFSISPSGQEQILHSFTGPPDGQGPWTSDLVSVNGTLYGTTRTGGDAGCYGSQSCGTAFAISTSGKERVIYRFAPGQSLHGGVLPYAGLLAIHGTLYGVTGYGGAANAGTVFALTTAGSESLLYSFDGTQSGAYPYSGLTLLKGELYGTTVAGGEYGFGTVFAISTSGKERLLYAFKGSPHDGMSPDGSLLAVGGNLYGTTTSGGAHKCFSQGYGCGTVFEISPSGKERVIYDFKGGNDGATPAAGLIYANSAMYGTTYSGGTGTCSASSGNAGGCGTIFKIAP